MEVTPGELLDRLSIVRLKAERIGEKSAQYELIELENAFLDTQEQFSTLSVHCEDMLELLKTVNGFIWDLEADIRRGKEQQLGLEEVGRRALMIRDLNSIRVWIKNLMARATGVGQPDIKKDHASTISA